jgi:hypothetical protein
MRAEVSLAGELSHDKRQLVTSEVKLPYLQNNLYRGYQNRKKDREKHSTAADRYL